VKAPRFLSSKSGRFIVRQRGSSAGQARDLQKARLLPRSHNILAHPGRVRLWRTLNERVDFHDVNHESHLPSSDDPIEHRSPPDRIVSILVCGSNTFGTCFCSNSQSTGARHILAFHASPLGFITALLPELQEAMACLCRGFPPELWNAWRTRLFHARCRACAF